MWGLNHSHNYHLELESTSSILWTLNTTTDCILATEKFCYPVLSDLISFLLLKILTHFIFRARYGRSGLAVQHWSEHCDISLPVRLTLALMLSRTTCNRSAAVTSAVSSVLRSLKVSFIFSSCSVITCFITLKTNLNIAKQLTLYF